ncbi:hypothetical protein BDP67DRAFT_491545 [Colletotrichum lupini]|nr:hypothetical protein BDP67DRAFT_491545 [Colletotrichum lupini]
MSEELRISRSSIIPLEAWLDLVDTIPEPGNPAAGLTRFLREDFAKMSCGFVVLDTSNSRNTISRQSGYHITFCLKFLLGDLDMLFAVVLWGHNDITEIAS